MECFNKQVPQYLPNFTLVWHYAEQNKLCLNCFNEMVATHGNN